MAHDLVRDRMERKFVVSADEAEDLLARLPAFERQDGWVTTVYFDRPDQRLTRRALASPSANVKIRLREYLTTGDAPKSPFVWVELKERERLASRKHRFQLHKRLVERFLGGELDLGTILTCQGGTPSEAVEAVGRIREAAPGPLVPVGAVRYRRRSVQGGPAEARLTVDQEISYHRRPVDLYESVPALDREAVGPAAWEEPATVVELKYRATEPPRWCATLLRRFVSEDYSKFRMLAQLCVAEAEVA
jgi:SPX domain protein involved in polyphosphate accumulation